ncbi:hypothetical protein SAMN02745164_00727 [Marinitoga hydrogenitolerans DSM 16785]|uniref:Uncharacterized protein n=1 Tax=Marinitoga hydrogenitolerans (strain DSM 16785 / JCM 12826 / AT1271) TaxID=1122195 RepID=A0A1M4ULU7_MARH1|nr:hypothetical protein [Marinitoga hydrogenitolerans]SHE57721.1 hypothetical protein SAMN02745164_00727 [Marinitoga hydrogenitolerans DSM 16785]
MKKYLFIVEILLLFLITQLVSANSWFGLLYLIIIGIEIYKDIFSKKIDEMERYLRYKTSNITLYITIAISAFFLSLSRQPIKEIFFFYTLFPLLLKNILYIGYIYERKKVIKRTGYTIFLILFMFTILSHGFSIETLIQLIPWLLVLLMTWISIKYRILGSILFFFAAIFFTFLIFKRRFDYVGILVYSLIGIPLIFLGFQTLRKE